MTDRHRVMYVARFMSPVFTSGRIASLATLVAGTALLGATSPGAVLILAPALLLLSALVLGVSPGEQLLGRMRARRFAHRTRRAPTAAGTAIRHTVVVRRVASLATSALAMRPPPAALAPIS